MRHNEGMPTDFSEWITATTGKSANALTKLIGKDTTAITRPDTSGSVPAHTVIAVCRAAGVSILDGLEVAGHIDHTDREIASATGKLDSLPDSALLTQLLHRAATREQDDHNDTGPSNSPRTPLAPVTGLHTDPLPYAALTDDTEHRMDRVQDEGDI